MENYLLETFISEIVDETLDEVKFNPRKELSPIKRFSDRIDYVSTHGLIPLGEGTSRIVFLMDSKKVLKLAQNQKGLGQNEAELDAITNPVLKPIFAKIYDYSSDFSWIVSELVRPIKKYDEFEQLTGMKFQDFGLVISSAKLNNFNLNDIINRSENHYKNDILRIERLETVRNSQLAKHVIEAMRDGDLIAGDIDHLGHWGKTADGRVVLLDYGFTTQVSNKYY